MIFLFVYYILTVHKQPSAKKQVKATAWHNKQKAIAKQKEIKENEKASQPCKYFSNGFCKSVSILDVFLYF